MGLRVGGLTHRQLSFSSLLLATRPLLLPTSSSSLGAGKHMGGPRRAPNLKRTLAVQLLLLTLLLSSSPGASAARPGPQRTLQQLSDGAATDDGGAAGPAAEPGLLLVTDAAGPSPVCAALVDDLLGICAISADRIAMTYGRGSEVPPTAEEQAAAIAELKGAGLPPLRCVVRGCLRSAAPGILQHCRPSVLPPGPGRT